jgi:hypothetical protein
MDEKPDLVLFAGDYFQTSWERRQTLQRELHDFFHLISFDAPLGIFAVQGNVDRGVANWGEMFDGLRATVVGVSRSFDLGDFQLTCLSLYDSFNPSLDVRNESPERFHIVLGHVPNFALGNVEADLLVAGHTHGGQIRFPFVGAIVTNCSIPRGWASGLTELPSGGRLLVSRGIGLERRYAPKMRFFCRPELTVIDLIPEDTKSVEEGKENHR